MGSKHERYIQDARQLVARLREDGRFYDADVVLRLVISSEGSLRENQRVNREYRALYSQLWELRGRTHGKT